VLYVDKAGYSSDEKNTPEKLLPVAAKQTLIFCFHASYCECTTCGVIVMDRVTNMTGYFFCIVPVP